MFICRSNKIDDVYACIAVKVPNYVDGDGKGELQVLLKESDKNIKGKYRVDHFVYKSHEACIEDGKEAKIEDQKYEALQARLTIEEAKAKKAVLSRLRDPDSAKFGKFTLINDELACLTVNARNSMGGYTGNQEADLYTIDGEWQVLQIKEPSEYLTCAQSQAKSDANDRIGSPGKVLRITKDKNFHFIEVESKGNNLCIVARNKPKFKEGDVITPAIKQLNQAA